MLDLVIKNGRVVDGSGLPSYIGDVGIKGGKIARVGRVTEEATQTVDAKGKVVAPGFIDPHTHFDAQLLWDGASKPAIEHGVTTIVPGNCSLSLAPLKAEHRMKLVGMFNQIEEMPLKAFEEGVVWDWETFPEYLDALSEKPLALDVATQVPHAAVRAYVMGQRGADNEVATEDDLKQMAQLVREGMAAGALGFTSSRTAVHVDVNGVPVPGTFADVAELSALGQAVADSGHGLVEMVLAGVAGEDCDALDREMLLIREGKSVYLECFLISLIDSSARRLPKVL